MIRTYDVSAFRGQTRTGDAILAQSLIGPDNRGETLVGALKVAQWFVIQLLTIRGSVPYDTERGTGFMTAMLSGRIRSEIDAFVAFSFAVGEITAAAILSETPTTPSDERFAGAALTSVLVLPGVIKLHIALTTRAGITRPIILPVATAV